MSKVAVQRVRLENIKTIQNIHKSKTAQTKIYFKKSTFVFLTINKMADYIISCLCLVHAVGLYSQSHNHMITFALNRSIHSVHIIHYNNKNVLHNYSSSKYAPN